MQKRSLNFVVHENDCTNRTADTEKAHIDWESQKCFTLIKELEHFKMSCKLTVLSIIGHDFMRHK